VSPKDMTRYDLIMRACRQAVPATGTTPEQAELLRRLGEADALRKENEELRDALIDARSWMNAGMFEDVPPQYSAMVANVDAMLSHGKRGQP